MLFYAVSVVLLTTTHTKSACSSVRLNILEMQGYSTADARWYDTVIGQLAEKWKTDDDDDGANCKEISCNIVTYRG
jgi:hypothetical protein